MNNQINDNILNEYAIGIMLQFTKDEYKNDETLNDIKEELNNLYYKVTNSELYSYFFHCVAKIETHKNYTFCSKYDFSNVEETDNEKNFFILMKDLTLKIKAEEYEDFMFIHSFIFSFFSSCNKHIHKSYENTFLSWQSFDTFLSWQSFDSKMENVLQKIHKVKKIVLRTESKTDEIKIDCNSLTNICKELNEDDSVRLIFENKEIILYKIKGELNSIKYIKPNFHDLLPYIFNTKNYTLMSKCIHLIDYKILDELTDEQKNKINKFIQYSNKLNKIILQKNICVDVVQYIVNKMINPVYEEINDIYIYNGKKILKKINHKVKLFLQNSNQKNEKDFKNIINFLLNSITTIDELFLHDDDNKKYKNLKYKIKIEIFKNFYKIYFTEIGEKFFKKHHAFLEVCKIKSEEFKSTTDTEFFHLIKIFQDKYIL